MPHTQFRLQTQSDPTVLDRLSIEQRIELLEILTVSYQDPTPPPPPRSKIFDILTSHGKGNGQRCKNWLMTVKQTVDGEETVNDVTIDDPNDDKTKWDVDAGPFGIFGGKASMEKHSDGSMTATMTINDREIKIKIAADGSTTASGKLPDSGNPFDAVGQTKEQASSKDKNDKDVRSVVTGNMTVGDTSKKISIEILFQCKEKH